MLSTNYIYLQLKIEIAFISMKKYTTKMIAKSLTHYTPLFDVSAHALVIKKHWGSFRDCFRLISKICKQNVLLFNKKEWSDQVAVLNTLAKMIYSNLWLDCVIKLNKSNWVLQDFKYELISPLWSGIQGLFH